MHFQKIVLKKRKIARGYVQRRSKADRHEEAVTYCCCRLDHLYHAERLPRCAFPLSCSLITVRTVCPGGVRNGHRPSRLPRRLHDRGKIVRSVESATQPTASFFSLAPRTVRLCTMRCPARRVSQSEWGSCGASFPLPSRFLDYGVSHLWRAFLSTVAM